MFETDFPHETGLFAGCWEHNVTAREQAARYVEGVVSPEVAFKVLGGNAAKLYGVDLEQAVATGASA
jgi:hypothetical protein